jgi:hypothetical protein
MWFCARMKRAFVVLKQLITAHILLIHKWINLDQHKIIVHCYNFCRI